MEPGIQCTANLKRDVLESYRTYGDQVLQGKWSNHGRPKERLGLKSIYAAIGINVSIGSRSGFVP